MINYETIISNFDDKVTLYNWLRKVEEALKNASATSFVVNKKGNATLSFSITFADGETLESGDIVLQQGESVDQARIASGILQLHLTNGTWLTAGNLGAVTNFSIDANQHLIVNYQDGTSQDLGAIFNGNVNIAGNFTANSIIENMTGYGVSDISELLENVYANVVKNGRKITFVLAFDLTLTEATSRIELAKILTPQSILDELYTYTLQGVSNVISQGIVWASEDLTTAPKRVNYFTQKSYNGVWFTIYPNELELNKKYLIRIEQTFTLGANLAQ